MSLDSIEIILKFKLVFKDRFHLVAKMVKIRFNLTFVPEYDLNARLLLHRLEFKLGLVLKHICHLSLGALHVIDLMIELVHLSTFSFKLLIFKLNILDLGTILMSFLFECLILDFQQLDGF